MKIKFSIFKHNFQERKNLIPKPNLNTKPIPLIFGYLIPNGSLRDYLIAVVSKCEKEEECFIIGGDSISRQSMPLADKLYITRVHKPFDADTFFPEISDKEWTLTEKSETFEMEDGSFGYNFESYLKKV